MPASALLIVNGLSNLTAAWLRCLRDTESSGTLLPGENKPFLPAPL